MMRMMNLYHLNQHQYKVVQVYLRQQHHQQREHLGEDRDAFEQEERQVHGAGDLGGGAGLARDAFRGGDGESTSSTTQEYSEYS